MNKGKIGSNKNIQGSLSLCLSLPTEKEEKAKIIEKRETERKNWAGGGRMDGQRREPGTLCA